MHREPTEQAAMQYLHSTHPKQLLPVSEEAQSHLITRSATAPLKGAALASGGHKCSVGWRLLLQTTRAAIAG